MQTAEFENDQAAISRLTEKERVCLRHWLGHATAKEIALKLGISHHAVEKRLKSARQKLGVATSLDAARLLQRSDSYGQAAYCSSELSIEAQPTQMMEYATSRLKSPDMMRRTAMLSGVIFMSFLLITLAFLMTDQPAAMSPTLSPEQISVLDQHGVKDISRELLNKNFGERTFAKLDVDSSGFIEKPELDGVKFNVRISDSSSTADETVSSPLVADADTDRDGRISANEYRDWLESLTRFEH